MANNTGARLLYCCATAASPAPIGVMTNAHAAIFSGRGTEGISTGRVAAIELSAPVKAPALGRDKRVRPPFRMGAHYSLAIHLGDPSRRSPTPKA